MLASAAPSRLLVALAAALVVGCAGLDVRGSRADLDRATLLSDKGRYEEASAVLRERLVRHPEDIAARRLLVRVEAFRGQLGRVREQITELRRVLGAASPIPDVELGHALEIQHRYEEALAAYDAAATIAPRDATGPRTGGLRAARWGELELAEPRLAEAVRRDAGDAEAWHALGLVRLHLGDLPGAEAAYGSGLRADPGALENRVGLATLALRRGDPARALVEYDVLLRSRPRLADLHLGRSFALLELGRVAEAREAIAQAERLGAAPEVIRAQRRELERRSQPAPR